MSGLSVAEPVLTVAALCAFLRMRDRLRFPALRTFLIIRTLAAVLLAPIPAILPYASRLGLDPRLLYLPYPYCWWASYVISAAAIYFVIQEMLTHVLKPLPGLKRVGLIAFRCAASLSIVLAIASALLPGGIKGGMFRAASIEAMRFISILELCLLSLLAYSIRSLRLSLHSRAFGVGLGLGLMASMDFLSSVFGFGHSMHHWSSAAGGFVTAAALSTWVVYFLIPEAEPRPLALTISSPLLRWNDIAMALGHSSPQVVVAPSREFFLQGVDGLVDKALSKNSMKTVD